MTQFDAATPQGAAISVGPKPIKWASVIGRSFSKLSPRVQLKNPVMFVVYLGSIVTTLLWIQALRGQGRLAPQMPNLN
jgi:K+-transporting ATPase ATPase B chain